MRRLLRSPKILTGLRLSAAFAILAIIGPYLAPFSPDAHASTTVSIAQPPSAAHLLGTTQTQQDVLSQLLVGGRSTVLVSLVAGVVATVLAVEFGVAAGYLAGWWDELLSMLANVFLVLLALPLLIVIFESLLDPAIGDDLSASSDTARVSQILTRDGYAMTGGKWMKNGQPIKFTIEDPSSYTDWHEIARLVRHGCPPMLALRIVR